MFKLKTFIATAALALCGLSASAQSQEAIQEEQSLGYRPQPYTFIQVQGGANKVFSPGSKFGPTFSLGVGRMFSPIVGARLHANGYQAKNQMPNKGADYKYKYITADADLMLNLVNIFSKTNNHLVDVYLIGGVGLTTAWDNKEFQSNLAAAPFSPNLEWGKGTTRETLLSHNIRAGILADINVHKNWAIGLEVDVNSMDDRFNSKYNNADDWMVTGQLSITYKFGHKSPRTISAPVTTTSEYVDNNNNDASIAAATAANATASEISDEPINETIFFQIRETESAANRDAILAKVVTWCKKYPNKTITIDGYADKGTGNPRINQAYAQQRAMNVKRDLQKKGVPEAQMTVASHGDTVQPFAENDKNRCVIIVGK